MPLTPEDLAEINSVLAGLDDSGSTGPLRSKIRSAITKNSGDPDAASLAICVLLENEVGLAGNGWFDDDDVVLAAIS